MCDMLNKSNEYVYKFHEKASQIYIKKGNRSNHKVNMNSNILGKSTLLMIHIHMPLRKIYLRIF